MILRPKTLANCEVKIKFNLQDYEGLEIDLAHVNKNKRTNYSIVEVADIFVSIINEMTLKPSDEKKFDDEFCAYYVKIGIYNKKNFKVVFCICSDRPRKLGVITLYRL